MKFIADFHIHSKYSRATSPEMDIEHIAQWAKYKGIDLVGTGDFTHPLWFAEIKSKLKGHSDGIYEYNQTKFILTAELSLIYSQGGKTRKIHLVIFAPSIKVAEKINQQLGEKFNLVSDGRPILGISAIGLAEILFGISKDIFIVPAHAWTPWFSIFGSKSGFDSIEECFGPYAKHIRAIETGLSSDPAMNWRLSKLDNIALISCSDAHSPSKLGREACIFDCEMAYPSIIQAISTKDKNKFLYTIEFFPEEGKYHYDGHSSCKIRWSPMDTKLHDQVCSICNKKVTVGVMNRVDQLADREIGIIPENAIPFKNLIPLQEIIAEAEDKGTAAKSVNELYRKMIKELGPELRILLEISLGEIRSSSNDKVAEGIERVRSGKVSIKPGYDGLYGEIRIFPELKEMVKNQVELFDVSPRT